MYDEIKELLTRSRHSHLALPSKAQQKLSEAAEEVKVASQKVEDIKVCRCCGGGSFK
jgi:hypothetical protein